jgi:hypothetical protein
LSFLANALSSAISSGILVGVSGWRKVFNISVVSNFDDVQGEPGLRNRRGGMAE